MEFTSDFMWGCASAAYQIEGAYNEDGRGMSIWDIHSLNKDVVAYNENGNVACDHYHRYKEDVQLFKQLGIKYYRFSISWTRVLPNGIGEVNEKGLQFYIDLVDELLSNGIEPIVTLHHWDYPYELYKLGGWMNPASPEWFEYYTKIIVDALSDKVKYWITINEPQCIVGCGYYTGTHAPFVHASIIDMITMSHNILLSHGRAVKYIRENAKISPQIGYAPTGPSFVPEDDSEEAIEEARLKTMSMKNSGFFAITWWSDPIFLGKYPDDAYELFGEAMIKPSEEDMKLISQPLDFYAVNIYYSSSIRGDGSTYETNSFQGAPKSTMNWRVDEIVMYWSCKFLYERYKTPILISENGIANIDWVGLNGKVEDPQRIDYISRYLLCINKAMEEGIPVIGYMYWSAIDNFEWACGYDKRFGMIYVDYQTQKRTIKESGHWYKQLIESNGEVLEQYKMLYK